LGREYWSRFVYHVSQPLVVRSIWSRSVPSVNALLPVKRIELMRAA